MTKYRCKTCRRTFCRPEFRRVGLSSVCSAECLAATLRRKPTAKPPRPLRSTPDDIPLATRDRVLVRDRLRCRWCGSPRELHIHHINYRSEGVDHSVHNLIVLCHRHHDAVHADKGLWQPLCRAYIWLLYVHGRQTFLVELQRHFAIEPTDSPETRSPVP